MAIGNHLHLQKGNMICPLRCLPCPLSLGLSNNGCMCQNSERGTANGLELSASNCCFVFPVRGSENRDGGGGKEKHAGSFSPLSWHLGFVEGFSPSHFPSIEKQSVRPWKIILYPLRGMWVSCRFIHEMRLKSSTSVYVVEHWLAPSLLRL